MRQRSWARHRSCCWFCCCWWCCCCCSFYCCCNCCCWGVADILVVVTRVGVVASYFRTTYSSSSKLDIMLWFNDLIVCCRCRGTSIQRKLYNVSCVVSSKLDVELLLQLLVVIIHSIVLLFLELVVAYAAAVICHCCCPCCCCCCCCCCCSQCHRSIAAPVDRRANKSVAAIDGQVYTASVVSHCHAWANPTKLIICGCYDLTIVFVYKHVCRTWPPGRLGRWIPNVTVVYISQFNCHWFIDMCSGLERARFRTVCTHIRWFAADVTISTM